MSNTNPKVSIIIPVYNGSNFLHEAIDSALAQTYNNIEVIVINDGSNDEGATEKIAKSYGNKISYYKKENGGIATALNLGIEKMTGEYFSWLSHDDMYYPNKIKTQISLLKVAKDKKTIPYSNYAVLNMFEDIERGITIDNVFKNKPYFLLLEESLVGRTALIPKAVFGECGNYNVNLKKAYDYELWQKIIQAGYNFTHQEAILARKRIYKTQSVSETDLARNEAQELVLQFLKSFNTSEMVLLDGSEYNFYIQNKVCLKNSDFLKVNKFLDLKIQTIESDIMRKIKQTKARITVITPVYNRAHLIEEVLESVSAQIYKDFVYIILDDGSVDNSGRVVSKYIADKGNWFYLYHENVGEAETVNIGWSLSYSEYFVQINSDDPVKPNLFFEMTKALDKKKDYILAYPDFDIIDDKNKLVEEVRSPDYNFLKDLSGFSCYAASPGAFMRKSALRDVTTLKDSRFKHTNDIKMLWNLALRGDFLHVPKSLAYWRAHGGGISSNRYEAIPEIEVWINEYFNQPLPKAVKDIERECRRSIYNYYASLIEASDLSYKHDVANYYREKAKLSLPLYSNLQIGDNDLIGNKFNGHDLHINLRKMNIESHHLVLNKQSKDDNTYVIAGDKSNKSAITNYGNYIQKLYDLDNIGNPIMYDVLYNKLFLDADVVHLHLMHNGIWDLNLLPVMSKLKPIVWTIHDMWVATGHPRATDRPDYYLPFNGTKNHEFNYSMKYAAIANSDITYIVASKYMEDAVSEYEMFNGKKIHYVPFGLDFETLYPRNKNQVRLKHGIKIEDKVLLVRGDNRYKKGLDYIEYAIGVISKKHNVHVLIVGGSELELPDELKKTYFGWINDDELMAELYSAADLFLMPSTIEPFGMMAIESMACGTMPIVIDGTALPDTVNSPHCGISVERNFKTYAETVDHYLSNNKERSLHGKKCIEYVHEKHNMVKYLATLDKIYSAAIDFHKADEMSQKLLQSLKENNQTIPRLQSVKEDEQFDGQFRKQIIGAKFNMIHRTANKLNKSIRLHGFASTLILVIKRAWRYVVALLKYNYINLMHKLYRSIRRRGYRRTLGIIKAKISTRFVNR